MGDGGLARLGEVLDAVGARYGLARSTDTKLVWSHWTEIVGPAVTEHAEPSSLRNGLLKVRADSPAWANELSYLAPEIKRRINQMTGRATVTKVKVWTGPGDIRKRASAPVSDKEAPAATAPDRERSNDPMEAFERARRAWERRMGRSASRAPENGENPW